MFVKDHLITKTDGVTFLMVLQKQRHHLLQIQSSSKISPCEETSINSIQVVPTKNIFMKIIVRKNFSEFLGILPNHLIILIQTNFRFGFVPEILIQNLCKI
jgi:hypothetical protein